MEKTVNNIPLEEWEELKNIQESLEEKIEEKQKIIDNFKNLNKKLLDDKVKAHILIQNGFNGSEVYYKGEKDRSDVLLKAFAEVVEFKKEIQNKFKEEEKKRYSERDTYQNSIISLHSEIADLEGLVDKLKNRNLIERIFNKYK